MTNNTGEILDGEAFLHIDYQGICGDGSFDGEGIKAQFSVIDNNWLNFSGWENGTTTVSGFSIAKGETQPKLKIETHPALCPGEYIFNLELKGTAETGEEYPTTPTIIGRGGGYFYTPLTTPTTDTGIVTATPGEGGKTTLISPDGSQIELIIPPGALSQPTTFFINQIDIGSANQPEPNSGLFLIAGCIYEITAQQADGSFITEFIEPLTLIFTCPDEQIEGLDESSLKVYYWDGENWIVIENSQVNIDDNTVAALVDHFTLFALMGFKIEPIEEKPTEKAGVLERITEIPGRIIEGIEGFIERVIPSAPSTEEEPSAPEEAGSSEEAVLSEEEPSQRMTASMAAAIGNLVSLGTGSIPLGIIVLLIALGIVLLIIRGIRSRRKSKLN